MWVAIEVISGCIFVCIGPGSFNPHKTKNNFTGFQQLCRLFFITRTRIATGLFCERI